MQNCNPIKLALLGTTGVGKDSCVGIIKKLFPLMQTTVIQLAEPLYQAQDAIYRICQKEKDYHAQDGVLLNFLGQHMRKINPDVLRESFLSALKQRSLSSDLILCCDVRPIDVPFVRAENFFIVHITANPDITLARRHKRGDLSIGNSSHQTEKGISSELYDYQIINNGTFEELEQEVKKLMNRLSL